MVHVTGMAVEVFLRQALEVAHPIGFWPSTQRSEVQALPEPSVPAFNGHVAPQFAVVAHAVDLQKPPDLALLVGFETREIFGGKEARGRRREPGEVVAGDETTEGARRAPETEDGGDVVAREVQDAKEKLFRQLAEGVVVVVVYPS